MTTTSFIYRINVHNVHNVHIVAIYQ